MVSNFFIALTQLSEEGNLLCVCAAKNVAETSKEERKKFNHYPHTLTSFVSLIIHSNRVNEGEREKKKRKVKIYVVKHCNANTYIYSQFMPRMRS